MIYDKHKLMNFDIPIIMEFKSVKNGTDYSWGLTKNFSHEGFSFETVHFNVEPQETLELKLKFPRKDTSVSVHGDVIGKRQVEKKCIVDVKLRDMNKEDQREFLTKISSYGSMPIEWFLHDKSSERMMRIKNDEETVTKPWEVKDNSGIKKEYAERGTTCMVTFRLPKDAAPGARKVAIVGDFNDWDQESKLMEKRESGDFSITVELKTGREYRFRYLIDGVRWENDWYADKYMSGPYGCDDSVVVV